jgi:hypothetical protein
MGYYQGHYVEPAVTWKYQLKLTRARYEIHFVQNYGSSCSSSERVRETLGPASWRDCKPASVTDFVKCLKMTNG